MTKLSQNCFVSRQIEGKGIGVIAIRDIPSGELIIREEPLLIIPWWVRQVVPPQMPRNELEDTLCRFVDELPSDKKAIFMSLSDCKAGENEEKSELGIWRTNNFALGRSHSKCSNGIFPTIARFNHSCIPSAEFCWNEKAGKQEIRAIRNIRAQEEITLCYFTSQWQLEDSDVRRHYLLEYYGFCCTCRACELTGDDLKKDSGKRQKIKKLRSLFDDLVYEFTDLSDTEEDSSADLSESDLNRDLQEALSLGLERFDLMDELGLKCRSRLDFCSELLEVAIDCNATQTKPLIIQRGLDLAITLFGPNHPEYHQWRDKLNKMT